MTTIAAAIILTSAIARGIFFSETPIEKASPTWGINFQKEE